MKLRSIPITLYRRYIFDRIQNVKGSNRFMHIFLELGSIGLERINDEPQSIFERGDWDNLIILDACRRDVYEEVTGKDVPKRITLDSTSQEFAKETFSKGDFSDIVYITANGYLIEESLKKNIGRTDVFHAVFETFKTGWDKELGTVPAEAVVKDALTAEKLFPDKRKIIHFMQPHEPYVETEIDRKEKFLVPSQDSDSELNMAYKGLINREDITKAYKKNLEYVLPYVDELNENLSGKTVVTADHGELLGENNLYRHPGGSNLKILREVPWDVISEE